MTVDAILTCPGAFVVALAASMLGGCAGGPRTQLEIGGGNSASVFEYRDVFWRPAPGVEGGIEVIGYGFVGFYNDPISRDFDPRWPRTGRVVIRLHGASQPSGEFAFTLLGPSMTLGPGDDEMVTGQARRVQVETGDGDRRIIKIPPTPVQSRNRKGESLSLSGTMIARRTDDSSFERLLRRFNTEKGYRDLPHVTQPRGP